MLGIKSNVIKILHTFFKVLGFFYNKFIWALAGVAQWIECGL